MKYVLKQRICPRTPSTLIMMKVRVLKLRWALQGAATPASLVVFYLSPISQILSLAPQLEVGTRVEDG